MRAIPVLSEGAVEQLVALRDGGDMGVEELLRDRAWFVRSSGQSFTITAEATARSGARHRAEMVVRLTQRSDRSYIVLAWREPASEW